MQLLRINHDQERKLLPLHELRQHKRVQLGLIVWGGAFARVTMLSEFFDGGFRPNLLLSVRLSL